MEQIEAAQLYSKVVRVESVEMTQRGRILHIETGSRKLFIAYSNYFEMHKVYNNISYIRCLLVKMQKLI